MNWLANHNRNSKIVFALLAIGHLVGIIGLNSAYHLYFEKVAWLNLLFSFVVVIAFHQPINRQLLLFCGIAFLIGMLAEIVGVNTGQPFGQYYYTDKFGWQVMGVPLIIGLNWVLLGYVIGNVSHQFINHRWGAVFVAALGMVLVDLLLEPFAIRHGLWVWGALQPPLQNYLAWFAVGVVVQFAYSQFRVHTTNVNALRYLMLLTLFLAGDLLLGYLFKPF